MMKNHNYYSTHFLASLTWTGLFHFTNLFYLLLASLISFIANFIIKANLLPDKVIKVKIMGNCNTSIQVYSNGSQRTYQIPKWTRSDEGKDLDLTLFHGTTPECAASILTEGKIRPSKDGRIGPGIYFTDDHSIAISIGTYRSLQRNTIGCVLITCKVKTKQKFLRQGRHPKWAEVCDSFNQYCVEKGQVTIKQVFICGIKDNTFVAANFSL